MKTLKQKLKDEVENFFGEVMMKI